jgi:hypothetical protein
MRKVRTWFYVLMLIATPACGLLLEEGREVVADVGGESIRLKDLMQKIRTLPFDERARTNDANESVRLEARRSVLNSIINERLLVMEAEARGITVSDEEIYAAFEMEERKEQSLNGVIEGMEGAGSNHGHSHENEEHTRQEITEMRGRLLIKKLADMQFLDENVRKYYAEHINEFTVPGPLVSYEIIGTDPANSAVIDRVRQKAIQEGTTLQEALASLNNVPPNISAGITPLAPLSRIIPEIRNNMENLKAGEISFPFHLSRNGKDQYLVGRVIEYTDKIPFESLKDQLRGRLFADFIKDLKKQYKVVYHDDILKYQVGN